MAEVVVVQKKGHIAPCRITSKCAARRALVCPAWNRQGV